MVFKSIIGATCTRLAIISFNTFAAIINIGSVTKQFYQSSQHFFDPGVDVLDLTVVIDRGKPCSPLSTVNVGKS